MLVLCTRLYVLIFLPNANDLLETVRFRLPTTTTITTTATTTYNYINIHFQTIIAFINYFNRDTVIKLYSFKYSYSKLIIILHDNDLFARFNVFLSNIINFQRKCIWLMDSTLTYTTTQGQRRLGLLPRTGASPVPTA